MWLQNYDPFSSPMLSTLMAALPVVVLLGLLVAGRSALFSAVAGLMTALLSAVFGFGMPAEKALAAAGYGALFGLLPISWIVLAAVFLYHLTVKTGQFEVIKRSVAALSPDRRMQALLIAFSFGSFLEGAAGFGTPVAISAALLIGLGFTPLYAAGLSLIANTSPVAFGALGTPIITLARVSGLPGEPAHVEMLLSQMAGRQLPLFSLIVPAWLVVTMGGWRALASSWPAVLVCGGSFAVLQFVISNYHGPALVDVGAGLGSMIALSLFLRIWRPQEVWRFPDEPEIANSFSAESSLTPGKIAYAWFPWLLLSIMVFAWGWPDVKLWLNEISKPSFAVPALHEGVARTAPVVVTTTPEKAIYEFSWLSATGTGIFLASILSAIWLRVSPKLFVQIFAETVWKMREALLTIACMLALAFTTKYSGSDATLGLAFTHTGWWYPFFAPLLGWLGVALTGSDTSSNALFGSLQRITAEQLGLNPTLIVASNSTGGVMGKMIDAQSIVVAAVATGQRGGEGTILRFVFWHSLVLAGMVGVLTMLQAYVLPWMIPK